MGIRQSIANLILPKEYKLGNPATGGSLQYFNMLNPPGWGSQSFLKAYGEIGILFSVCNVIARGVAKVDWHLYETDSQGNDTEIMYNPILDLMNKPNAFQSRYSFMYLGMIYKLLIGEQFWQMNFNGKGLPGEMWQMAPGYTAVIPSAVNYIDHYEYKRQGMSQPIKFDLDEIVHIYSPNPMNPYRGISPAQALTQDLDLTRYGKQYQTKIMYNDGSPGFVIEYPPEGMPPAEQRKELQQEYDERYKGIHNAGKTLFLWGGKANVITMTNRDMNYDKLALLTRDEICAGYHCPPSCIGITESVNRSNAETSQYQLAQYCIHPELVEIREQLNKDLVPFFGDNLRLDFENPIPEDATAKAANAVQMYKAGIITLNEARDDVGLEPDDRTQEEMDATTTVPGDRYMSAPPDPNAEPVQGAFNGNGDTSQMMNPTDAGAGGTKLYNLVEQVWYEQRKQVKASNDKD